MESDIPDEVQLLAEKRAAYCKVLGSSLRVLILWLLTEREMTLVEIASAIGASNQSTSRHLNILEFNKLIGYRQDHSDIYYHLAKNDQTKQCPVLKDKPQVNWDEDNKT